MKKWLGDKKCNICFADVRNGDYFVDGRIQGMSSWALMCQDCYENLGAGIGPGFGQKYNSKTFEKLEG